MGQPVVFANDDDFQRFLEGMRLSERLIRHGVTSTNTTSTTTNTQPTRTTVKITDVLNANGEYPAIIQYYNNDTLDSLLKWYDGIECVAVPINENDLLNVGQRYDAQIIGTNQDDHLVVIVGVAQPGGFFARLTAYNENDAWKAIPQTLDEDGFWMDSGGEFEEFCAIPLEIDGSTFASPAFVGMRVWMINSKQAGYYEFLPITGVTVLKITGEYGGGGYPWIRQKWVAGAWVDDTLTGSNLIEVTGNESIPADQRVIAWKTPTDGDEPKWMCSRRNSEIEIGCGLADNDGAGPVHVDLTDVAEMPLVWTKVDDECFLNLEYGCGLGLDADNKLVVNLTGVAVDGITWNEELCGLSWNPGCHTFVGVSPNNGDLAISVNTETLVGDKSVTALVSIGDPVEEEDDECPTIGVDLDADTERTTVEVLVNDVSLSIVGGKLRLTKQRTIYTNFFNAAGLHIDRVPGITAEETQDLDICDLVACCTADPLMVECDIVGTDYTGEPGDLFYFTSTVTGGVGPYTFDWDWDDDTAHGTTEDPSHVYATAGTYNPTVTVTDSCGTEVLCGNLGPIVISVPGVAGCSNVDVASGLCGTYPVTMVCAITSACPELDGTTGTSTALVTESDLFWLFTFTGLPAGWSENFALRVSLSEGICTFATYEGQLCCETGGGEMCMTVNSITFLSCTPWTVVMNCTMSEGCEFCSGANFTMTFTAG